jgi:hypothetical protein
VADADTWLGRGADQQSYMPKRAFAFPRYRLYLHRRGVKVWITRRGVENKIHLGRHPWAIEQTIFWVLRNKGIGLALQQNRDHAPRSAKAGRKPHVSPPTATDD